MNALVFVSILVTGTVAGIFYAFSTFIMGALGKIEVSRGIAAMQSINIVVINPLFFLAFFGAGIVALATTLVSLTGDGSSAHTAVIAGTVLYVVGTIGVTIVGNVPLNNRLADVDPESPEGSEVWQHYLSRWTFYNHVRTMAALAACASFVVALQRLGA